MTANPTEIVGRPTWSARDALVPHPDRRRQYLAGRKRSTGASAANQGVRPTMQGAIVQVNISPGGLPKRAIAEGWITPLGIEGDLHAHPNIHGGPLKAILIIAAE